MLHSKLISGSENNKTEICIRGRKEGREGEGREKGGGEGDGRE